MNILHPNYSLRRSAMKRIIVLVVLSIAAVLALAGCGGGGGGTPANAANFSVLNAGVYKNVVFYSPNGEVLFNSNITSAITVNGNMVSVINTLGNEEVFIGGTVHIEEK